MKSASAVRLAPGIRLRRSADGSAALLVPEGLVNLSPSAQAIMELIDGSRDTKQIAAVLAARYGTDVAVVRTDVEDLLAQFVSRLWVELPTGGT